MPANDPGVVVKGPVRVNLLQQTLRLRGTQRLNATFAGLALFVRQLIQSVFLFELRWQPECATLYKKTGPVWRNQGRSGGDSLRSHGERLNQIAAFLTRARLHRVGCERGAVLDVQRQTDFPLQCVAVRIRIDRRGLAMGIDLNT